MIERHGKAAPSVKLWAAVSERDVLNHDKEAQAFFRGATPAAQAVLNPLVFLHGLGAEAYLQTLEKHAAAAAQSLAAGKQGAGVWSFNPNKWGLSPDQANAYDLAKAQADAAQSAANPGVLDAISQTAQGVTKNAGNVYNVLMWAAGAGLLVWGVSEIVAARGEAIATGAVRTARALKH